MTYFIDSLLDDLSIIIRNFDPDVIVGRVGGLAVALLVFPVKIPSL